MKYLHIFWGKVREGKKRGKELGFPTANIRLHKKIPEGIYAAETIVDKIIYRSAAFIGAAKTFGEKDYKAETYILDFHKNLYGTWITLRLLKKIRENKNFTSKRELVEQMKKDVEEVRNYTVA